MTPPSSKKLKRRRKWKRIKLKFGIGNEIKFWDIPAFGVGFSFYGECKYLDFMTAGSSFKANLDLILHYSEAGDGF